MLFRLSLPDILLQVTRRLRNMYVQTNDILIDNSSERNHSADLCVLFHPLSKHGITTDASTYELGNLSFKFLGKIVLALRIAPQ